MGDILNKGLISVIIPVYNTALYLRECLDSVCNQTYKNLEIICVNDGSTDDSLGILQEYAAKDKRIHVISQENRGQAAARNAALDYAHGEWITGLDSDDYLALQAYERVMEVFPDDCDLTLLETTVVGDYNQEVKESSERYYKHKFSGAQYLELKHVQNTDASLWDKIIRRSVIEKNHLRFPENRIFEDACFFFCLMGVAKKAFYLNEKLHFYRLRSDSTMSYAYKKTSRALDHLYIFDSIVDFYEKSSINKTKSDYLAYAADYCGRFAERYCPSQSLVEVITKEREIVARLQLAKLYPFLSIVSNVRRYDEKPFNKVFRRFLGNREQYGLFLPWFSVPVFSITHEWKHCVYRILRIKICTRNLR